MIEREGYEDYYQLGCGKNLCAGNDGELERVYAVGITTLF